MRHNKNTETPSNEFDALERLMQLSNTLLTIAEKEKQCLRQNDVALFEKLQDEKQPVSRAYLEASQAFREQIMNYKDAPSATLSRLEDLQEKLQEKSQENNAIMSEVTYRQQYANTGSTLFATQALGQDNSRLRQSGGLLEPTLPYSPTHRGRA